jgi:phosphate-selective porin OprO/OprP
MTLDLPPVRLLVLTASLLLAVASAPVTAQHLSAQAPAVGGEPPSKTEGFAPRLCWEEHPCVRFGDLLVVSVTAAVQADWWWSDVAYPAEEEILRRDVARRRFGVTAEVMNGIEVRLEREFADEDEPWRDRYVNVRAFEALQLRAGSFKLPFSRDEDSTAEELNFAFHSQSATLLAPGRDRGVMLHGTIAERRLGYEFGVFDHDGRNARTGEAGRVYGDRTLAGRLSLRPWPPASSGRGDLRVSIAFTTSEIPEGTPSLNGRTVLDVPYYSSSVYVNGHQRRVGAGMEWRSSPCSVLAEYLRATDERLGESVEDSNLSPFIGEGWLVGGTCGVIGERRTSGGPSRRTLLPSRGVGFVELGARYERLRFGSVATGDEPSTSPRADVIPGNGSRILTLGLNWHLNRWVRLQANTVREALTEPERGPFPNRTHFWSRVLRIQFLL